MVKPAVRQDGDGLAEALREARLAEAAHFEAALDLRDSKTLRLQVLKDELRAMLADGVISPEERDVLRREAKRLHISPEEVERMVQEAKVERELIVSDPVVMASPMSSADGTVILLHNMQPTPRRALKVSLREPAAPHSVEAPEVARPAIGSPGRS